MITNHLVQQNYIFARYISMLIFLVFLKSWRIVPLVEDESFINSNAKRVSCWECVCAELAFDVNAPAAGSLTSSFIAFSWRKWIT